MSSVAPSLANRSCRVWALSAGSIGVRTLLIIAPVSSPASISMMVTPVSV